jgi:large subunit ribosomal protein L32
MVIRMRHTRGHSGNRRSHHALKAVNLSKCSHCGAEHRPHHMCLECGYYNGRQVMDLEALKAKRDARIKAKKERIKLDSGETTPTAGVAEEKK